MKYLQNWNDHCGFRETVEEFVAILVVNGGLLLRNPNSSFKNPRLTVSVWPIWYRSAGFSAFVAFAASAFLVSASGLSFAAARFASIVVPRFFIVNLRFELLALVGKRAILSRQETV
jgi:hypothetical protein